MDSTYDNLRDIDERYLLCEMDAELRHVPEKFGSRRIGIAIIGVGRMGAIHLYNTLRQPRAELLWVLDANPDRLTYMRRKYYLDERGVKCIGPDQIDQVIADKQVEALIISTPTFTHEQYARLGLENEKHVLCEKPLAESLDAVNSLVELAQAKQLKLVVALQRRLDPSFRRVYEQTMRGDIGQPRIIKTVSRDSPLPPIDYIRTSGGFYHDCIVHDVDLVLWVARELPEEVHAYAHTYNPDYAKLGDVDTTVVTIKFSSGLMAMIDASRVSATGYEQRLEVYGPKGCVKVDEMARLGWEKHTEIGVIRANNCYSFSSRYMEAYAIEINELCNHIEGNKVLEPIRPGHLNALCKIVIACDESARSKLPVKLQWSKEEIERTF